ncbi:MAG: transcriptional regulator [Alphaproteobacteria bacterium]|nr:transcriptional regulator [Alphaproteobacteria bacterium]
MTKKNTLEKTRSRILMMLKQDGPQEASHIAKQIGVTDMAIRQHLYTLEEQGDITHYTTPRPKGRPAKVWQLTDQASTHFPNSHAEFSTGLISSIEQVFGQSGMEKLLEVRFQEQIKDYNTQIPAHTPLKNKLEKLAAIRSREGYMADILPGKNTGDYLFVENNCPVCEAAKSCTGICARELDLFREILGEDVTIERDEHIIEGARRCAYVISPSSKAAISA